MARRKSPSPERELIQMDLLQLDTPQKIAVTSIDSRGWRRISVATGRCSGNCSRCTCVSDLQAIAGDALMGVISFGVSGSPLLSHEQIQILRAKREKSVLDDSTDSLDISVEIPPAPLTPCSDDDL